MEQFGEVSIDFQSDRFYYSRPSKKIYVAYFMYPAFFFVLIYINLKNIYISR